MPSQSGTRLVRAASILCLLLGSLSACWAQQPEGSVAADSPKRLHSRRMVLYPRFLEQDRSAWISTSGAQTRQLAQAHSMFMEALVTGNFHRAILAFQQELAQADHPPWAAEALWHIAEGYHRMRHFQEASEYWSLVLGALPDGYMARRASSALAESLFQCWRLEEALGVFRTLAEKLPHRGERAWALFRTGDCLTGLKDHSSARAFYERAVALTPEPGWIPPESLENTARIALDKGRGNEAALRLMTALSLHGEHPRAAIWYLLLGRSFKDQGKFRQAAVVLERLMNFHPLAREARIGAVLLKTLAPPCGEHPVWLTSSFAPAELNDPSLPLYYEDPKDRDLQRSIAELADCMARAGDIRTAWEILGHLQRGMSQDDLWPEFHRAAWHIAAKLLREAVEGGRPEEAIALFQELTDRSPGTWRDPGVLLDGARAYEIMGFLQIAAELYGRVRTLGGKEAHSKAAAMGLFRCHLAAGRLDEASRVVRKESMLEGSWKQDARRLLDWAGAAGTFDAFQIAARWAAELEAGRVEPNTVAAAGRVSIERGLCEVGTKLMSSALGSVVEEVSAAHAEAWVVMGDLLRSCGRELEAAAWYGRAVEHTPWGDSEKWAAFRLVQAALQSGPDQRVLKHLEKLLEEPPGSPWRALAEGLKARMGLGGPKGGKSSS